jgi:hypothetical protein
MIKHSSFRYFKTSPEVIRLGAMLYVRLSATNAFNKALDKLIGVCQSRTSFGMQWSGIQPVMQF